MKPKRVYSKSVLEEKAPLARNLIDLCRILRVKSLSAGAKKSLKRQLQEYQISTAHFTRYHANLVRKEVPWQERLIYGRPSQGSLLRKSLQKMGRAYQCQDCGVSDTWNGKPITLQVDHINADVLDNRPENLRFLCPNCHSQTDTWGYKLREWEEVLCLDCDLPTGQKRVPGKAYSTRKKTLCAECVSSRRTAQLTKLSSRNFHTVWPPDAELEALLQTRPATQVAKDLGVSSTAVKKHCTNRNIQTPSRGHWSKVRAGK